MLSIVGEACTARACSRSAARCTRALLRRHRRRTVSYTSVDHTYANDVPGVTLTPEDPLAGLDEIAGQVRESGITGVDGNVIIDDRLFDPPPAGDPDPNFDP